MGEIISGRAEEKGTAYRLSIYSPLICLGSYMDVTTGLL